MSQAHPFAIKIVTISSQYGSGGEKTAVKLALRLGWRLVDQEIPAQVAEQLEMPTAETAVYNERTFGLFDRFLIFMRYSSHQAIETWAAASTMPLSYEAQEQQYRKAEERILKNIAQAGRCVIIGHAAQIRLAHRPDALHIRFVAPLTRRISYIMQQEHLSMSQAISLIKRKERKLEQYIRQLSGYEINDPLLYDLMINSHALDSENQIKLICQTLEGKAKSLLSLPNDPALEK
ncbi:MAG TPA: cytidylate kinase-like family protein [Ktedonobacteraceae bacterium]